MRPSASRNQITSTDIHAQDTEMIATSDDLIFSLLLCTIRLPFREEPQVASSRLNLEAVTSNPSSLGDKDAPHFAHFSFPVIFNRQEGAKEQSFHRC